MTNHEKFIEIFGETNGAVKASEEWLGKEYVGPVSMTEREKFLEWLEVQPFISYKEDDSKGDVVYIYCSDDKTPIIRVSDFGKFPGTVYIRIDGLCGDKPLSFVKEVVMRASSERMDKHLDFFDGLYNEIFGRKSK